MVLKVHAVLLLFFKSLANGFTINEYHPRLISTIIEQRLPRTSVLALSAVNIEKKTVEEKSNEKVFLKKQREIIAKKPQYLRGAGVFKEVKKDVTQAMKDQFESDIMNQMKDSPNYMLEKDGVELYLAKDHGFCWGGEILKNHFLRKEKETLILVPFGFLICFSKYSDSGAIYQFSVQCC